MVNRSISTSSAMNMGQQGPPSPVGAPPSLGQQYFTHIEVDHLAPACHNIQHCCCLALRFKANAELLVCLHYL